MLERLQNWNDFQTIKDIRGLYLFMTKTIYNNARHCKNRNIWARERPQVYAHRQVKWRIYNEEKTIINKVKYKVRNNSLRIKEAGKWNATVIIQKSRVHIENKRFYRKQWLRIIK